MLDNTLLPAHRPQPLGRYPSPDAIGRIYIIVPMLCAQRAWAPMRLNEAQGLVRAYGAMVCGRELVYCARFSPKGLLGQGRVMRLKPILQAQTAQQIFVDHDLTPGQQARLQDAWGLPVLTRTEIILKIFAQRARSREGQLQVARAQASYLRSRLIRRWTHLERQRGGTGRSMLAGPGEKQLESDRRQLDKTMRRIDAQLRHVGMRRALQSRARQKLDAPLVSLVGYTNTGKSTLFNRLCNGSPDKPVLACNTLFATLDPHLRQLRLPDGLQIFLSDTVGFISNLPPELVAAFRATLDELCHADILLHVRDASHPDHQLHNEQVIAVLERLGLWKSIPILTIWNKKDLRPHWKCQGEGIGVSALTGEGLGALQQSLSQYLRRTALKRAFLLPLGASAAVAWLHQHAHICRREVRGQNIYVVIQASSKIFGQFAKKFPASHQWQQTYGDKRASSAAHQSRALEALP